MPAALARSAATQAHAARPASHIRGHKLPAALPQHCRPAKIPPTSAAPAAMRAPPQPARSLIFDSLHPQPSAQPRPPASPASVLDALSAARKNRGTSRHADWPTNTTWPHPPAFRSQPALPGRFRGLSLPCSYAPFTHADAPPDALTRHHGCRRTYLRLWLPMLVCGNSFYINAKLRQSGTRHRIQ